VEVTKFCLRNEVIEMIKTVMARSRNLMPQDEINEEITKLGPGWKVVSTAVDQKLWGKMESDLVEHAKHVYIAVVIVLEKPDEPTMATVIDL
jgi:hypothetical protein